MKAKGAPSGALRRLGAAQRQLSKRMNGLFTSQRLRGIPVARDLDVEQAWLRVGIGSIAFIYACYLVISEHGFSRGLQASVVASGAAALVGAWMVYRLRNNKENVIGLRYLAIATDISVITIAMAGADEGGVPFVGLYLWVTVGNGFRFGPKFLLLSYWLSLIGYGALLLFVPFWVAHRAFSIGLLVVLGIVPLYVLVLLTRLTAQKDAAEQLSSAKSRFVANVSHELRTPLTGVFAVYELLRGRKMTSDDRELVGMLGSAVNTLKTSVDAVLLMSKLEAGAESKEPCPFNLWYFLQQLTAMARPQSVAKGLAWHLRLDPQVPPMVIGDQGHLGHVLSNLVNNAFKFTSHGSVTLRVSKLESGIVRFEVIDTGIGIPLEQQERLFERFVQVDTSPTRRHGGTGLGTSIARDLVELMDGRIGVVSAPGEGSTFWIEVPLSEIRGPASLQEWTSRQKVLIVGSDQVQATEVATAVRGLEWDAIVTGNDWHDPPTFEEGEYFAAILVMDAAAAATYADAAIRDRGNRTCPWIVLAPDYSATQRAALICGGAAGLLTSPCAQDELSGVLGCLQNRLEQPARHTTAGEHSKGIVRSLTIVLADDNRSNQFLLSRILRDAGHTVTTVESGAEAFDLMGASNTDLALLDLNMPDMSGPDVVKLFRASSIGAEKLPIIILSADATASAKRESIEAGASDFLTKPISASSLLSAIQRVMAGTAERVVQSQSQGESESSRPALAAPFVDVDRIQALRRIARGDEKFLDQYTSAAFEELEKAISDLRLASASGNERAARDALHIIEGTGASIGANALVANSKSMRNYFGIANDPDRAGALAEISTSYALTKSTVLASLHHTRDRAVGGPKRNG